MQITGGLFFCESDPSGKLTHPWIITPEKQAALTDAVGRQKFGWLLLRVAVMDRGMKRSLRIVALFAVLLSSFYLLTLLPWLGKLTEERANQAQMAATAPLHLALPEPRQRKAGKPDARFGTRTLPEHLTCQPGKADLNCVPAHMSRIPDLVEAGKYEEARDLLLEILKTHPGNVNASNTLALLYRHRFDDPERAERFFHLALEGNPDRTDVTNGLSELYLEGRGVTEGLRYFRILSARHPANASLKLALGALEIEDGAQDRAVSHLNQAIKMMPDMAKAYELLAEAHLKAGRPESAAASLKRLMSHYLEQKRALTSVNESTAGLDADIARVRARLSEVNVD